METHQLNKTVAQIFESRYIIPLYQRNFAWREPEISRLLKDVFEAYKRNPQGNYFIGSLVVRRRRGDDFEVIDGQQRLTALSLITKLLDIKHQQHLGYDSRPYVEEFLNSFYTKGSVHEVNHPSVTYLREAVEIIKSTNLCDKSEGDKVLTIYDPQIRKEFADYFANHVILVRVEIPEDTDVASYFEIMNNRGEQLQEHEILKSLLISKIKDESAMHYDLEKQKEFSLIWDACSQMDEPIQKLFNTRRRRMYFGPTFDNFTFEGLGGSNSNPSSQNQGQTNGFEENENQDNQDSEGNNSEGYTLDEILSGNYRKDYDDRLDNVIDEEISFSDETKYASIIDFPNFLMHIFKAFYNKVYQELTGNDVPLDAKFMLSVYDKLKNVIDPNEFIFNLFRSRTFFDRYVVKTIVTEEDTEEDKITWSLQRVRLNGNRMYFVNTFTECSPLQDRAVKALSMLQVTFRNRKYKNWLQEAIQWFKTQTSIAVHPVAYIRLLDEYMLKRYEAENYKDFDIVPSNEELTKTNSISSGVGTAHFLFTFIDYLYWVESGSNTHGIKYSDRISNFDFKYWNSVEHHLSQKKAQGIEGSENFIDNLGNLCLVSKSANSRLSDRDVKEKVQAYSSSNMGANRQIIYSLTQGHGFEWDYKDIKDHYNDLIDLLSKRRDILYLRD